MGQLRLECLGTTYLADPMCDDVHATLPLEVHTVEFNAEYYTTTQGNACPHLTCIFTDIDIQGRRNLAKSRPRSSV